MVLLIIECIIGNISWKSCRDEIRFYNLNKKITQRVWHLGYKEDKNEKVAGVTKSGWVVGKLAKPIFIANQ